MRRVLHVFNSTIVSGPETLVMPALSRLPALGVSASVVILTESRRHAESANVVRYARELGLETHEIPVRSRVDSKAVRGFARLLERLSPEIVHSHDVKASTYALKASRALSRSPILVSTHHGVRGRSGLRARLYEAFYTRFVLPHFDRVLAVCASDHELLLNRGLIAEKVELHRNGVDRPEVAVTMRAAEKARIRDRWKLADIGVPADAVLAGFVGRIAPEKRLDRILEVCRLAEADSSSLPDWRFLVFGRGPLETELRKMTRAMGLENRVLWMGYRASVGAELAGLDLLVAMSDAEGLPINLVEAGWAGTPVLATAVDGILDLVPDADHGILLPVSEGETAFGERLTEALRNPDWRHEMGRNFQRRVVEQFSGTTWLKRLTEIYANVQGQGKIGLHAVEKEL